MSRNCENDHTRHYVLINCRLADRTELCQVWIGDGIIQNITPLGPLPTGYQVIDIGGRLLAPGFIDVHIQGTGGADILDGKPETLPIISQHLAQFGTTGFLATTVVHADSPNHHLQQLIQAKNIDLGGAKLLGIHLEGPFINRLRRGGISEACISSPSAAALQQVLKLTGDGLRMMTIAPELDGNLELIGQLHQKNIISSFGHSDATYEQTQAGIAAGISHVTHLFNAMPPLHHRQPGPLLAIFEDKTISAQIISDGVHIHPRMVRLAFQLLGPERCICITDGVQAMGLPEGRYFYNGREYESKNGTARYLDGTLIGSTLPLAQMVRRFFLFTGCSLQQALEAGSLNPARILGLEHKKGSITPGKDADVVALEEDFTAYLTIIEGKIVWHKD